MSKHVFFVTCPKGVEYLLADELKEFGLNLVRNAPAGVWVEGELESGYRACLWSPSGEQGDSECGGCGCPERRRTLCRCRGS